MSSEHAMELEDIKHVVHLMHTALHMPEHHLLKERQLLEKLDNLKQELSPLEEVSPHVRLSTFPTPGANLPMTIFSSPLLPDR